MNRSYHFPFVVHSKNIGTFRYDHHGSPAIFTDIFGDEDKHPSRIEISHFLKANAQSNPNNDPEKDYYISEGYGPAPESSAPSIAESMRYAEETARNMFGRDESRGIVNFGKFGFYGGGLVGGVKIKSPSEVAAVLEGIDKRFVVEVPSKEEMLRKEVDRLTGELTAAHATIKKVREALRTQPGEDVQEHARVLRQMADALVNLWRGEK